MAVADSFIEPENATTFPSGSSIRPIFSWYIPIPLLSSVKAILITCFSVLPSGLDVFLAH